MSKKNKCVGLDCEMCGNTKCPNEEKEKIIDGIDLSKYFKNHYDSWGRLYCIEYKGNPLELQNAIKRLQEKNEELKNKNNDLIEEIASGNIDIKILQEENEGLKEKAPMKLIAKNNKYRSALEEIKEIVSDEIDKTDADDELMQIYGTIYNRCNEVLK